MTDTKPSNENPEYPTPEELSNFTPEEFEMFCFQQNLRSAPYEYARLEELNRHLTIINQPNHNLIMEGKPIREINQELELGWRMWGQSALINMTRKEYEELYHSCTYWSVSCESPIE